MNSSSVQRVYDQHVATLSEPDRVRLAELITRNLAPAAESVATVSVQESVATDNTWQPIDHRGDLTEWRDRVL